MWRCHSYMMNIPQETEGGETRFSQKLSEALEELGLNDRIIQMRRKTYLLKEKLISFYSRVIERGQTWFHFGSQSEGTTTPGLGSDLDCLLCKHDVNIIQSCSDWKPGISNLLVVQDENTSPGYCMLQEMERDAPVPSQDITNSDCAIDSKGRVLLKNSALYPPEADCKYERHGPALMSQGIQNVETDDEGVYAYKCETWPLESKDWLSKLENDKWPAGELAMQSENNGFFVVPVGSKLGEMQDFEWRISTSMAERLLMFSLNITQIHCYVLLKMMMKSFVQPSCGEAISSFISKTTIFHCINKAPVDIWKPERLVEGLKLCLNALYSFVVEDKCSHFMSYKNNLVAGRYSMETRLNLIRILDQLRSQTERSLLEIAIDDLGKKINIKLNNLAVENRTSSAPTIYSVAGGLLRRTVVFVRSIGCLLDKYVEEIADNSTETVRSLFVFSKNVSNIVASSSEDKVAVDILSSLIKSKLFFSLAVLNEDKAVGASVTGLFQLSLCNTADISSNQLKFSCLFYHYGDFSLAAGILDDIEKTNDFNLVATACGCARRRSTPATITFGFMKQAYEQNEDNVNNLLKKSAAFCICFSSTEEWTVPFELKHELYTQVYEEVSEEKDELNIRKTCVAVDSLTFLFFMQYKTNGKLGRRGEQITALHKLKEAIEDEDNLGHRETALNLLGQCLEGEGKMIDALYCYWKSLKILPNENVAKVLICCCLAKVYNKAIQK